MGPLPQRQWQHTSSLGCRQINVARRFVIVLPFIGFIWQAVLAQSYLQLVCAFLASSGSFLLFFDAFRPKRFFRYPLSTLVMLGFGVTLQLGPLLFTAFEGNTLIFNLATPVETFGHGVLTSVVCVVAHGIYRQARWLRQLRLMVQRLMRRLQIFQPLRSSEVVVMGGMGVFALALSSWFSGLVQATVVLKFIQGFQFFSIIPVAFLLQWLWRHEAGANVHTSKRPLVLFLLFMALIVAVSVGRNARAPFVVPLACLVIGLVLEWLYGLIRIRLRAVLAAVLAAVLFLPLAMDLATAMVMVRGSRGNLSAAELLDQTIGQLQDREGIRRYRITTAEEGLTADWSETYVDNVFLARFANAKFPDNSLENAARISPEAGNEMAAFQWWRLVVILPTPMLSLLGIPDDIKEEVLSYSIGDKLYGLASGSRYVLGGFRTGHFFGTGMAGFGFAYLLILLTGLLLVFPLVDAHALVNSQGGVAVPVISAVAITQFIDWFTFSNAESVVSLLSFPVRGFIEPVLLFALARWLLRRLRLA